MAKQIKIKRGEIKSLGAVDFQLDNEVKGCLTLTEGDTFIRIDVFTEGKTEQFGNKYHSHTMTKPQPPEEPYDPTWDELTKVIGLSEGRKLEEVLKSLDLKIVKEEGK